MAKKKTKRKSPARKSSTKRKKKTAHSGGFFRTLFKWGFVAGLWGAIILGLMLAWYAADLPDVTKAMVFERRPTIIVKASDGTVLDRYGDIKGESVSVEDLPTNLIYAILAIEDRRFYEHIGIDWKGIARAMLVNIRHGGYVQGGSTITQQLAKNLFLSKDRKLKRKIQEAMLALWLEKKLTKDEILSAYLNRVYMGSGAYGVDAAARVYYNKTARELTLRESATLAGLLKAPSRYSPASNPVLSAQRTKTVLQAMVDAGFIEEGEMDAIRNVPPAPRKKPSSGETVRYFTDYIVGQINDIIGPVEKDLIIETTLNKTIQEETEQAITKSLLEAATNKKNVGQGAAVVLRLDGAVMAMVGGRDYGNSQFNRATHSFRAPGSSFKPIVYLTALEKGWTPDSLIMDEPITEGRYRPANYGHEYYGEVSLLQALTMSLNTVSVNLMRDVGPTEVIGMARRLGITADLEPDLSLALGSSGVPVIQMATAYAALGRGGLAVQPYAITRVIDEDGEVYYEHERERSTRQVVNRQLVSNLAYMMRSVVENGTGQAAQFGAPVAGKTGTSQEFRDAWFIGFSDRYATAVWFGNDDNTPTSRVTGGSIPARTWREIMATAQSVPVPRQNFSPAIYGGYGDVEFSFHDMMSRILGGGNFGGSSARSYPVSTGEETTPLGRHQWDLND
jgi:penicillin-binding protein 1A